MVHGTYCENSSFIKNNLRKTLPPLLPLAELNESEDKGYAVWKHKVKLKAEKKNPDAS